MPETQISTHMLQATALINFTLCCRQIFTEEWQLLQHW